MDRSDEELMLAYRGGEPRAFETLLHRHGKGIYRFALRFLGDRMRAEEVMQESFLRVLRAASRYEPRSSFRNYLYRITRNLCLDLIRKEPRARVQADGTGPCGPGPEDLPDRNPGPDLCVESEQLRFVIFKALQGLPPEQREVFLLKEVKEMKLQDVADVTGANLNTVKSRLRYALQALREELSRGGIRKEIGYGL